MTKRIVGLILLASLIFIGQKQGEVFFCDTELTLEQVLYESASDTVALPPDSALQEKVVLSITAHVVRKSNGSGGLKETIILEEIERLNRAFAGAGISFEVCTFNYINDNRFYAITKYDEARLITYNIENTINIYFVNQIESAAEGKICGYTYYPTKRLDHVFMANNCVPRGTTLIHELGHFFGLYHTHELQFGTELVSGANCRKAGDLVCDTPADPGLRSTLVSESCEFTGFMTDVFNTAYEPPVNNYMSYSRQRCRNTFTQNQFFKMRVNYHQFKSHLNRLKTDLQVSDSIVVAGDSLTLEAFGGTKYWWSTGDTTALIKTAPDSSITYSVNIVTDNGCNVFKKYAVEVIGGNFITSPAYVCEGNEASIVLSNTKPHLTYEFAASDGTIIFSAAGNNGTLAFDTPVLTTDESYFITLRNIETDRFWQLAQPLDLTIIPSLSEDDIETVAPTEQSCQGNVVPLKFPNSVPGMTYQLFTENGDIGPPKEGNGDTLTIFTASIDATVTYNLRVSNACQEIERENIATLTPIEPPVVDELSFYISRREVKPGESATITIEDSDPDNYFQLMLDNKVIGKPVAGNNGDLSFSTPPLFYNSHLCLVTYNREGCRQVPTEYPIAITVDEKALSGNFALTPDEFIYILPEAKKVKLQLFYLDGRLAITIVNETQAQGKFTHPLNTTALPIIRGDYMLIYQVDGEVMFRQITTID